LIERLPVGIFAIKLVEIRRGLIQLYLDDLERLVIFIVIVMVMVVGSDTVCGVCQ